MHIQSRLALGVLLSGLTFTGLSAADPTGSTPLRAATAAPSQATAMPAQAAPIAKPRDPAADRATAPSTPRAATDSDRAGYAAREAASPNAQKYKGGDDVVIISAGTTALILGIVLLVVLL